ncbi:MAG: pilus assembly protein PilM [Candidatus Dormibacteraeota bacterium]|nr:pilus assembly protein PilM [Candidatus Dormibacteraeota bacterium]
MTRRLAIDLGVRELKIVLGDGRRVTRHAEAPLPEGAMQDGVPTQLLTTALRAATEGWGGTTMLARVAIADAGVAVRDFPLPRMPERELATAVGYEGRRLVPIDANELYYAWHAQRVEAGYAVYLVAARRDMIDAVHRAVSAAGLQVERIDLKPLALARGMGASDGLVLEWGGSEATLVLMVGGRPRFFRTFLLDAPAEEVDAQLDELAFSLNALVRFMRTVAPDTTIGPTTPLYVAGRFAFVDDGPGRMQRRLDFSVRLPVLSHVTCAPTFPWQAHLAGIGLLKQLSWRARLIPTQGGDVRVAA